MRRNWKLKGSVLLSAVLLTFSDFGSTIAWAAQIPDVSGSNAGSAYETEILPPSAGTDLSEDDPTVSGNSGETVLPEGADKEYLKALAYEAMLEDSRVWTADIGNTTVVTNAAISKYWKDKKAPAKLSEAWIPGDVNDGSVQFSVEKLDGEDVIHCKSGNSSIRYDMMNTKLTGIDYSQDYYLRAYVKAKGVTGTGFYMRAQVGSGVNQNLGDGYKFNTNTEEWTLYQIKLTDIAKTAKDDSGKMKIEIFFQGFTGEFWVKDIELVKDSGLELSQNTARMNVGDSLKLTAKPIGTSVSDGDIVWQSSNEAVASVSGGDVTALKGGYSKISARIPNGLGDTCLVLVDDPSMSAEYSQMRDKWTERLTGNSYYNDGQMSDQYRKIVEGYDESAKAALDTLVENSGTKLFSDLDLALKEGSGSTNSNDSVDLSTAMDRILSMARAWACKGSVYYQDAGLKDKIIYALEWADNSFYNEDLDNTARYGNWYHWWISMPQNLAGTAVLMMDVLNTPENIELFEGIKATLQHFNEDPGYVYKVKGAAGKMEMTGANLADTCLVSILRSTIEQDQEGVVLATENFGKMVQMVTSGEGIYADGSFIQHTNLAYTGGYGATLLNGTEKLIYLTTGSSWAVPSEKLDTIFNWIWDGIRPLYADGAMFEMVAGRSVARPNRSDLTTGRGVLAGIVLMAKSAPADIQNQIRSFAKKQLIAGAEALGQENYYSGMNAAAMMEALSIVTNQDIPAEVTAPYAWVYGGMDKAVAHNDIFSAGFSYASARTGRFEYGNQENSKGFHQSDGMLSVYNGDPKQYADQYWNTIDSQRLPGITTDHSTWALKDWGNYTGNANYNGGAVLDQYAAIAMNFANYTAAENKNLTAKKTWFVFDDEIVCLGAGITGIDAARDTETIVENKKVDRDNALVINGNSYSTAKQTESTEENVSWAWLQGNTDQDSTGYYFPSGSDVFVKRESRTGSYRDINNNNTAVENTPATREYVSLALKHGNYVNGVTSSFKYENYDYVLLPSKSAQQVEAYSAAPDVEILANNAYVQAAYDKKANVSSYVFWQPSASGSKTLRVGDVESDYATIVMKKDTDAKTITLAIADPLQNRDKVTVRLYGTGLEKISSDSNVTVTASDKYGVIVDVATKGTKGASFNIAFSYQEQSQETLDQYKAIRDTYADNLTGNGFTDRTDAEYLTIMSNYTKNAQEVWNSLIKTQDRTRLWEDLDLTLDYNKKGTNNNDSVPFDTTTDRIRTMTLAYASEGSSLYHNEQLGKDITGALQFVLDYYPRELGDKVFGNWWHWDIGIPQDISDITLLLYNELSSDMIQELYKYLDKVVPFASHCWMRGTRPYLYTTTAANMMDLGVIRALTGAIGNDPKGLYMASDALPVLMNYVTTGDGFYADGSYAQHGTLAYTGGYGADAIRGVAKVATLTNGTPWACTEADPNIVYEWILNAFRPLYADGGVFEMVTGRQISRYNRNDITTARYIMDAILALAESAPEQYKARIMSFAKTQAALGVAFDKDAYYGRLRFSSLIMAKNLLADESVPLDREVYTKIYGQMDKVVSHGSNYSLGISMYSNRKANAECGNSENFKGWYTSDGMTYLYNGDQTQYNDNFWPTVDMTRLAGITTNHVTGNLGNFSSHLSPNSWVGGSSAGKQYASVGMDFSAQFSDLNAKKSWFLFGDQIVALGTGITSTEGDFTETIVENRKIDNSNTILADGSEAIKSVGDTSTQQMNWAWLSANKQGDAIGYYFPGSSKVTLERLDRTGKWQDINTSANMINDQTAADVTRSYVTLSILHGTAPEGEDYSYVLLPGRTAEQMAEYAVQNGIEILANTDKIQAARDTGLNVTGINFWEAGAFIPAEGSNAMKVEAQQPASITIWEENGITTIGISDPTQKSESVTVEIAMDTAGMSFEGTSENITVNTDKEGILALTVNTAKAYGAAFTASIGNQAVLDALNLLKEAEQLINSGLTTDQEENVSSMVEKMKALDTSILSSEKKELAEQLLAALETAVSNITAANNAAAPFASVTGVNQDNAAAVAGYLAVYDQLSDAQKAMLTESQKAVAEAVRTMWQTYQDSLSSNAETVIKDALSNLDKAAGGTMEEKKEAAQDAISNILNLAAIPSELYHSLAQLEQKIKELTGAGVEIVSPDAEIQISNAIFSVGMDKSGRITVDKAHNFTVPAGQNLAAGAAAFNFRLNVDGNQQQLLVPVLITMKIPSTVDASKDIVILHITDDGTVAQITGTNENGYLRFTAPGFSTYVIANRADADNGNNGGGKDDNNNDSGNQAGSQEKDSTNGKDKTSSVKKSPRTFDSSDYVPDRIDPSAAASQDKIAGQENCNNETAVGVAPGSTASFGSPAGLLIAAIAGIIALLVLCFGIYFRKKEGKE